MEEEVVVGAEAVVEEASREDEVEEMVREGTTIQTVGKAKDRT